jgi:hypothetical protein
MSALTAASRSADAKATRSDSERCRSATPFARFSRTLFVQSRTTSYPISRSCAIAAAHSSTSLLAPAR